MYAKGIYCIRKRLIDCDKRGLARGECLPDHECFPNLARASNNNHEPWKLAKALSQNLYLATLKGHIYYDELIYSQCNFKAFRSASHFISLACKLGNPALHEY